MKIQATYSVGVQTSFGQKKNKYEFLLYAIFLNIWSIYLVSSK